LTALRLHLEMGVFFAIFRCFLYFLAASDHPGLGMIVA
jgi:hypothetical protein